MSAEIVVAKIGTPFGVRGWLHLQSYMESAEGILQFKQFIVANNTLEVELIRAHTANFVVKFAGIDDRDIAAKLVNSQVYAKKSQLPLLDTDEYYWDDLIGMRVNGIGGEYLGKVASCFATGANDVLVVKEGDKDHLIPFVLDEYISRVDITENIIETNWSSEALG